MVCTVSNLHNHCLHGLSVCGGVHLSSHTHHARVLWWWTDCPWLTSARYAASPMERSSRLPQPASPSNVWVLSHTSNQSALERRGECAVESTLGVRVCVYCSLCTYLVLLHTHLTISEDTGVCFVCEGLVYIRQGACTEQRVLVLSKGCLC